MSEFEELKMLIEKLGARLDRVAHILGTDLAPPMASTLESVEASSQEIKASNRTRWVVLVVMLAIMGATTALALHTTARMERMQMNQAVQTARLNKLIDLAEKGARPENKKALQKLKRMKDHTPKAVIQAAVMLDPDVAEEELDKLEDGVTDEQ